MSAVAPPTITADGLLRMRDGDDFELVDGRTIKRMMGAMAAWVSGKVSTQLTEFSDSVGGWVFGLGASYHCFPFDGERVRKPSVSYIAPGRLPNDEIPSGHLTIAPDLTVEVLSPLENDGDTMSRVRDFLEIAVPMVWLINPDNRSVRVFRAGKPVVQLRADDELTGENVLPGFRCSVAELFPPQTMAKSKIM